MISTLSSPSPSSQRSPEIHSQPKLASDIFQIKLLCCHCLNSEDYQGNETKTNLRRCNGCKSVWYCSKECQSSAWKTHRLICQSPGERDRGLTLGQWKTISGISTFYREGQAYKFPKIPKDQTIVCKFYDATKNQIKDLTQQDFRKKTGKIFTNHPIYSQTALRKCYENEKIDFLNQQPEGFNFVALSKGVGYELTAIKPIRKGTIIAHVGGKVIDKELVNPSDANMPSTTYSGGSSNSFFFFDTSTYAGLGAFINDGPPNCGLKVQSTSNFMIPKELVVEATRDIKQFENICVDYGEAHDVKLAPYFLSGKAYKRLLEVCKENNSEEMPKMDDMIAYIISTPYVLATLFLNGAFEKYPLFFDHIKNYILNSKDLNLIDTLLTGLSKIPVHERKAYAARLPTFSQLSLKILCEIMCTCEIIPTVDQFRRMGKLLDELLILLQGSVHENYWSCSKKTQFKELFLSEKHQNKLLNFMEGNLTETFSYGKSIPKLPQEFIEYITGIAVSLYAQICQNQGIVTLTTFT